MIDILQKKVMNPRYITCSVPRRKTVDNIVATFREQNPDIIISHGTIISNIRYQIIRCTLTHCHLNRTIVMTKNFAAQFNDKMEYMQGS
jgi:hypothetical protein